MSDYRALSSLERLTGGKPVLLAVDDWLAYEWAVYFLRNQPVYPLYYRMYFGLPHVEPVMQRAARPALEDVDYVLTDTSPAAVVRPSPGWELAWAKGPYRLWRYTRPGFALLQEVQNANGLEQIGAQPFFWMGKGDTTVKVFATREGVVELEATFLPGPSVRDPDQRQLALTASTGGGMDVTVSRGNGRLLAPV
jgi:hypothetical protein